VSPDAWVRYWKAGWVIGIVVAVYGAVVSEWGLAFLGAVIFFLTFGMVRFWRNKAQGTTPPESS